MARSLALFGPPAVPPGIARRWPILTEADRTAVQRVLDRGVLSGLAAPVAHLPELSTRGVSPDG